MKQNGNEVLLKLQQGELDAVQVFYKQELHLILLVVILITLHFHFDS